MAGAPPPDLAERAYQPGDAALREAALGARRTAVWAFGVVQIVLGGVCTLAAIGGIVTAADGATKAALLGCLVYILPAANLLLTGFGSVKIAPWARRVALFSAIAWLGPIAFGVFMLKVALTRSMGYSTFVLALILVVATLLSIASIVFYTRPAVRATFASRRDS